MLTHRPSVATRGSLAAIRGLPAAIRGLPAAIRGLLGPIRGLPAQDPRRPAAIPGLLAPVRRLLAVGAVLVLILAGGTAALADPGAECPPDTPDCTVWDDGGGSSGGGDNGGGGDTGGGSGTGGGSRDCRRGEEKVPCYDDVVGWFNAEDGCYYKLAEPQPPGGEEGRSAYLRTCGNASDLQWLDDPPGGFEQRASPQELAYDALATITLRGADIRMAPDPGGAGLVGLPVWMWTPSTPQTWGPNTASASQAGVTVTISAQATRITWDMGDGATVTCTTPGTPYDPSYGARPSPDCGYAGYAKPSRGQRGGKYRVTATTSWQVTWSGGGESGVIPVTRQSQTAVRIDELQVVTR